MQTVLYVLFICFIIWLVFSLLPIILPIVLIIVAVASFYIWRMKRRIVKQMEEYNEGMHSSFQEDTTYQSYRSERHDDNVIDVEFSEREDMGD